MVPGIDGPVASWQELCPGLWASLGLRLRLSDPLPPCTRWPWLLASSAPTSALWCLLQSLARSTVGTVLAQKHFEGAGTEVAGLLPAVESPTSSGMLGVQTALGQWKMEAGKKLKAGETAVLYLGTDKSALASNVLVTAQANRLQWDISQSPLSRDTSYLEKMLSCVHGTLCYLNLESGPEKNIREHQRRECGVAPSVQHLVYNTNKSSAWPIWSRNTSNPVAGYPQTMRIWCFLFR